MRTDVRAALRQRGVQEGQRRAESADGGMHGLRRWRRGVRVRHSCLPICHDQMVDRGRDREPRVIWQ